MSIDRREDAGDFYPGGKVISTRPVATGGDVKHSDFAGLDVKTNTIPDLREAVRELGRRLGATVVTTLAACVAVAATVQTVPVNDLDFDANPSIVTNVVFDASPDYSTNNTALVATIEATAPAPGDYAAVSNAAMNAASRVSPTITNVIKIAGYGNSSWELFGGQTGWYFTDTNGNTYRIELNSDSEATSNDVGEANNVLLASRKWVYDRYLPKSGGTVTGALTVQENLTVGDGSATGAYSVAEGYGMANGDYSHAEGHNTITTAFGIDAHAEGSSTTANGYASHVEGGGTTANGDYSHAEGEDTTAQNDAEHAQGRFNASHKSSGTFGDAGNTLSSIGFGTADSTRKNAVETMQDGKTFIYGLGGYDGTNPTNGVKDLVAAIGGKLDNTGLHNNDGTLRAVSFDTDGLFIFNGTMWLDVPATSGPALTAGDLENPDAPLYQAFDEKASTGDIPPAVSNVVTTALVRERLGVYLYVGADGGIYVHTNED